MAIDKSKSLASLESLSPVSATLNRASADLAKAISRLDEALQKLNLGVSAWVVITFADCEPPEYSQRELGYTKVGGKWGLATRHAYGDPNREIEEVTEPVLLIDSPRELRVLAVGKIGELLEELVKRATETAKGVAVATSYFTEWADTVEGLSKTAPTHETVNPISEVDKAVAKLKSSVSTLASLGTLGKPQGGKS